MAPRPANPDAVQKLLDAAQRLVLRQGFAGTGVDQICREAGITKGSFFHYFATKNDLGVAMLERFGAERFEFMTTGPHRDIEDPRDRLYAYLDLMIGASGDSSLLEGCLMGNLGQEVSRVNPRLRETIAGGMSYWASFVETDLRAAKRRYAPRARWQPEEVARHLIAVFQGSLLLVRICEDNAALKTGLEHYKRYVEGLLGNSSKRARSSRTGR